MRLFKIYKTIKIQEEFYKFQAIILIILHLKIMIL